MLMGSWGGSDGGEDGPGGSLIAGLLLDPAWGESCLCEQAKPGCLVEQAGVVGVVGGGDCPVAGAQEEAVLALDPGVGGIGIPGPLQVAHAASVGMVVAAVVGSGFEGFAGVVGDDDCGACGLAVGEGRGERSEQVARCGHVADGVVDEHGVEGPAQPKGAHVALDVAALGVELA